MYSSNSHLRSPSGSQYSNNPFIDGTTQTQERFPDINTIDRATGGSGPSYGATGGYGYGVGAMTGVGFGQQPTYGTQPQQQVPQVQPYGGWNASTPSYATFATTASPQMTGMPYQQQMQSPLPYGQQQQQYQGQGYATVPQYSTYPPATTPSFGMGQIQLQLQTATQQQQQQQQQTPSFLAEFDPYANMSNGGTSSVGTNQSQGSQNSVSSRNGQEHPREFIRNHRRELDMWDSVTWKQALVTFDALRVAWEGRKEAIDAQLRQGGYYMHPQEQQRMQGLLKEATDNIDSVTASSIQMQEVLAGYRQSSDLASKNRVRSSLNAALQSLPDWPHS